MTYSVTDDVIRRRQTESKVRKIDVYDIVDWIHELEDEVTNLEESNERLKELTNPPMPYTEFLSYILIIEDIIVRENELAKLLNVGVIEYTCQMVDTYVKLLEKLFKDDGEWIQHWIWECNFGERKDLINSVKDSDGNKIPLTDVNDLYILLVNNLKEKYDLRSL